MSLTILFEEGWYLAELYPQGIRLENQPTPRAALSMLRNFPGLRPEEGRRYAVRVDAVRCLTDLDMPLRSDTIKISPLMLGAGGSNGGRQILIGALMIAAAFLAPQLIPAMASLSTQGAIVAPFLFHTGAMMVLGGAMQLLQRAPKADSTSGYGEAKSRFITGAKNTVEAGTPIPLLYGRIKTGGHFLSFDVDAENYVP